MAGPFTTPVAESTPFEPGRNPDYTGNSSQLTAENVQDAIEESYWLAPGQIARFTLTLLHNGTVGNNTFFGYMEIIPGNRTPVILPRNCQFTEFTFSNNKTGADYGLEFRKNSITATPFFTTSKDNTQYFHQVGLTETFNAGDQIYVKYKDEGSNARDVAIVLFFKNLV